MIKKEKKKSIIVSIDGEFRRRMPSLLIEVGFPAEKFVVKTAEEVKDKIKWDKEVYNVVIHGPDFPGKDVFTMVAAISEAVKSREGLYVCVFLNEEQFLAVAPIRKKFTAVHFCELPASKKDLSRVFNPIGGQPIPMQKPSTQAQTPAPAAPAANKNVNFFETSNHVKDTIESLGKIKTNRDDLNSLHHIGQRFNGIFGAFEFVKDKAGYKELSDLAHVVDDIARHYDTGAGGTTITDKHFDLIFEAAKCTYLLLKDLRENKPLDPKQVDVYKLILKDFDEKFPEIQRRESIDQDNIDSLINAALDGEVS